LNHNKLARLLICCGIPVGSISYSKSLFAKPALKLRLIYQRIQSEM